MEVIKRPSGYLLAYGSCTGTHVGFHDHTLWILERRTETDVNVEGCEPVKGADRKLELQVLTLFLSSRCDLVFDRFYTESEVW
jgi:hypothetical protein